MTGYEVPVWRDQQRAAQREEHSFVLWARWAVVAYCAANAVNQIIGLASAHRYAVLFHDLHVIYDNRGTGAPPPKLPSTFAGWSALTALVYLAAAVVYLIWQYRAATTARALGYPANHSPGWGVAAWIVPVVSVWMPYQAVRDCLPPGHRARTLVARAWTFVILTFVVGATVVPLLAEVHPVGVVVVIVQVALLTFLGVTTLQVVKAIDEDHSRAAHLT